ncbi:MAG TPA: carboxypeptidase-like regulatory domain-containing protein [Vicinamibacterales bacterium]|nr:carboxypeptidase-like regulatory domain-containing protein [Vicinamibacterales bacterium]
MKSHVAIALVLTAGLALHAQTRGPAAAGSATLSGRVVRTEGSAKVPVARVQVSVGLGDSSGNRIAVTDDQGRFEFAGLPAGGYLLTASRLGWVTTYYGSPRPGRPPGIRVVVADGAKASVEVPIVPGSVIAGRIIDENSQPMARLFPRLLEQRLVGNRQMLARMRLPYGIGYFERQTNDLGEFRLFGLPPGAYHLVVDPSIGANTRMTTQEEVRWALQPPGAVGPAPPQGSIAGYASMYFPGTPDPSLSRAIVVGPGEVRDGLTFRIGFVPVSRIEGTIQSTDGSPVANVRVSLDARIPQVAMEGATRLANADANGRFVFSSVAPGDYKVSARSLPRPGAEIGTVPMLWAETNLVVSGQDTLSTALTLSPASSMTGRVAFAATSMTPPSDLSTVRLQFVATDAQAGAIAGGGTMSATSYNGTVAADGTFRVAGLPPDRYNVSATWPGIRNADGAGWWLTSISLGGKDIGDAPIEVRANEEVTNVTLGFRDRIGAIEGLLADAAGKPAPEYFVLAFPVERVSWTTTSRRAVPAVHPGTDGRFRVNGLLAGQYYLAVVTAVEPDDAMDPAFLEAILPNAVRVTVGEGQAVRQDLKIGR